MCSEQRARIADTWPLAQSPEPKEREKLDYVINRLSRERIFYEIYNTEYLPTLSTDNEEGIST